MGFSRDEVNNTVLFVFRLHGHDLEATALEAFCQRVPTLWQDEAFKDVVLEMLLAGTCDGENEECEARGCQAPDTKHVIESHSSSSSSSSSSRHLLSNDQSVSTCPICFDEIGVNLFRLACGHTYCATCMQGHCNAVAFPSCPEPSCIYKLSEEEVGRASGRQRLEDFRSMQLQEAISQLPGRVECPNPTCNNVVMCDPGIRQQVICQCGWPGFCSNCRQPYHYGKDCSEVGVLREQWSQWVTEGRRQYNGCVQEAATALQQQNAVQETLRRQRELEEDERYKAENCRCCPKCNRVVQKLSGCDSMKCGENYHGGDRQDGCGASFDWTSAPRYVPRIVRKEVPKVDLDKMKVEGKDFCHFLVACDICGSQDMRGPRFRCVHCPDFNMCANCDQGSTDAHAADHVFEILFTPEQRYNHYLPAGAHVELVGLAKHPTLNLKKACVERWLPQRAAYDLRLCQAFDVPLAPQNPTSADGLQGLIGSAFSQVAQAMQGLVQRESASREDEMALTPGARVELLAAVPACFVQVCSASEDLGQILEAIDSQRAAAQKVWTALPKGQEILVTGLANRLERPGYCGTGTSSASRCIHFSSPETCATCALTRGTALGSRGGGYSATVTEAETFTDEQALVAGWFMASSGTVSVRVPGRGNAIYSVQSSCVQPVVKSDKELAVLQQFQEAQTQVNGLRLHLPEGQRVEVLREGSSQSAGSGKGYVAVTTAPYDPQLQCYQVRFEDQGKSEQQSAKAAMAEQYGIADLVGMTAGELVDLWDTFKISRNGLESPDHFLERAMEFLPAQRPEPLIVAARYIRPLIEDASEFLLLQASAKYDESQLGQSSRGPSIRVPDTSLESSEEEPPKCSKCGDSILGCVIDRFGAKFHFGCAPEDLR
eukprot:TRINITY_DN13973_c0_g2_i1.p1 TRINITY_DN13973_c0_g2~~TRINITY_DN13973_c0_g2_i1.p1  ORF type:complete len:982 (+),score=180.48 TRINITY_DN13973_c0_g2_i1:289-2946(+)